MSLVLAGVLLFGSQIACCGLSTPRIPDIEIPDVELPDVEEIEIPDIDEIEIPDIDEIEIPDIDEIEIPDIGIPTIEAGEMIDQEETIPLDGAESATVEVTFGAGELKVGAGMADALLSGQFRYNVERWEPEVSYEGGRLSVVQGGTKEDWGIPTGNLRNEWDLAFSPKAALDMVFDIGAGVGMLDLTGLQLTGLDLDMGAGDCEVRFEEPNEAKMDQFKLNTGASKLEVTGIGNASPAQMKVQGGVGDVTLDFTGAWANSADVEVTSGVGSLVLRVPDDVGVRVETEGGLTDVDASGLEHEDGAYVNGAFGEADTELRIEVTTGIGSLQLIEVSN